MKVRDIKPGMRYVVTKGCSGLRKGDRLEVDANGYLHNFTAGVYWGRPAILGAAGAEVELDQQWRTRRIAALEAELAELRAG